MSGFRDAALVGALALAPSTGCGAETFDYVVDDPAPASRSLLPAPVSIVFGGDVMIGRDFNRMAKAKDPLDVWSGVRPVLDGADVVALNFEGTITSEAEAWPEKAYNFRLEPRHADELLDGLPPTRARPVFFSLANNHSLDFGRAGSVETRAQLTGRGFAVAGTGADDRAAAAAAIVETADGVRIGFLSATTHCGCSDRGEWSAAADREGAWVLRFGGGDDGQAAVDAAVEAVADLRDRVDVVVFSVHWGANWNADDDASDLPWMKAVAEALIEAGVDVVLGHSAHHSLPVQNLGGGTVIYGAGDLVSDYRFYDGYRNDLSFLAEIEIRPNRTQNRQIWPTRIRVDADGVHRPELLDAGDPDYAVIEAAADPESWASLP